MKIVHEILFCVGVCEMVKVGKIPTFFLLLLFLCLAKQESRSSEINKMIRDFYIFEWEKERKKKVKHGKMFELINLVLFYDEGDERCFGVFTVSEDFFFRG